MMEKIEQHVLNFSEQKQIFNAIALSILRGNKTFSIHDFYGLSQLHNLQMHHVAKFYAKFIKDLQKKKRCRKLESIYNVDLYELI